MPMICKRELWIQLFEMANNTLKPNVTAHEELFAEHSQAEASAQQSLQRPKGWANWRVVMNSESMQS